MRESRTYGSVRGALSNGRPYRDRRFAPRNDDNSGRPHQVEGNIQFPTIADARMDHKAPIEPKDVDAIVDYLISIRAAN